MGGVRGNRHSTFKLTPVGWALAVSLVVLVALTIAAPSTGVFVGLAAVILLWALLLGSSFPTRQGVGVPYSEAEKIDYGRQAAEEYERKYGHRF